MRINENLAFALGFALLMLGAIVGSRLARDCRSRGRASALTVALVWASTGVHLALVVLAATRSTWHFELSRPLALGGGGVLAGIGSATYLGAVRAFGSLRRLNFQNDTRLVTEGVYRWSRNPQLVGWTLVLVGLGLCRGSAMVLLLAFAAWVGYRLHLPTEEEHLRHVFGETYETYCSRAHRYFGRPGEGRTGPSHRRRRTTVCR